MKGNIRKAVKSDLAFDIFANGLGIIIVMVVLIPLIFVVAASFSDPDLVIRGEVLLFPKGFTVDAYVKVFEIRTYGEASAIPAFIRSAARRSA